MRTLLSSDAYELLLGPQGFELRHRGRSLLGPFALRAEGQDGQPLLLTSEAALYTLTTTADGSIELRYPAADGSGLLWIVHARLDENGLVLWQSLRNQSLHALTLSVIRLIAQPTPDSFATGAGTHAGWQVFRTGYSSFSPSFAVDSRFRPGTPLFPTAAAFNQHSQSEYYGDPDCLSSPWMLTLTEPGPAPLHLLIGFVSARAGLGEVALRRTQTVSIEARLGLDGRRLAVGETLVGDKLLIAVSRDEQSLLANYTDRTATEMSARVPSLPVPSGWCSWYYYYTHVREHDVLSNLTALTEKQLPVKYVQLDDGYQRSVGDWLSTNAKFPSGLGGLARQIKQAGFVPGIWLAPFFVQRSSEIFRRHRDWLLRDEDGKLRRIGYHPFWGIVDGQLYSLDLTHPQVIAWLRRIFSALCELGFEYFKIDFLFAGLRRGRRHDPSLSPLEAYRQGLRVIRDTIGDRFLLGCGAPLLPSIGLCDAMRISPDVKEDWRDPMVDLIAHGTGYPSAEQALHNCLTRAHLHGKWWLNDPDCVLVRRDKSSLTLPEVQTLLSVMSLSGGMLFLSDDLRALPAERLHLVQMALPPSGLAGRALGVLTEEKPQRFVYVGTDRTGTPTGLATLVNWQDGPRELELSAEAIGLPHGTYHAFELWTKRQQLLSPGQSLALRVAPHGSALWLLRKASPHPQVVSLSHHLWQTLLLLDGESYDPAQLVLSLVLRPLAVCDGDLRIAVPAGLRCEEVNGGRGEMTIKNQGTYSDGVTLRLSFHAVERPISLSVRFVPIALENERS
ncbi:MAG: alpha-galactosidase [Myxococcales bacterium]|nr:alpha-galactosidase [Myxococcales bacterium]